MSGFFASQKTGLGIGIARIAACAAVLAATLLPGQQRQPGSEDLEIVQVRPNFYMIAGAGGNIAVQIGPAGVILVDSGSAPMQEKVLAAVKRLSSLPIRYIFNTSADADHVGGNPLSKTGVTIIGQIMGNVGITEDVVNNGGAASVLAHDNVIQRMTDAGVQPPFSNATLPSKTYTANIYSMYLNGDGIQLIHQPAAHSDGDSVVFFRRSDVIVTGDIFDTTRFPVIEVDKGGTIQGEIDALNRLIRLSIGPFPIEWGEDRTLLIPGHGRVCDQPDLLDYRDMVTIIRDVIQDMIDRKMTLEQVRAANPTKGYNLRYGSTSGPRTTNMFVEAVYKSLSAKHIP
ncbi:MAG: MBL fold metallo-hydrolase [Acidobacteriota bacterium]|nr:MBL fold metallo-hydrolase [Acidobacteriota bacterium]